jgi:hypothetical protein
MRIQHREVPKEFPMVMYTQRRFRLDGAMAKRRRTRLTWSARGAFWTSSPRTLCGQQRKS